MKRLLTCVALVGALALGARSVVAQGPEGPKGTPATLSDAAQKAIKTAFPNATVDKVSMVGRGDSRLFSALMTEGEKRFTVGVSDSGIIVRVSTPVANLTTLPKAVTDAVKAAFAEGKIVAASKVEQRAETMAPHAKLEKERTIYEVRFLAKGGPPQLIVVAEDGTVIRAPRAPKKAAPAPAQPS